MGESPAVYAHADQVAATGGLLAELPDRDTVADDVLTAALYLASGIDWAAESISMRRLDTGVWRVAWTDGSTLHDVPVDGPATAVSA